LNDEEIAESDQELSWEEKTRLIQLLLGPPERWDEADSRFAMKIYGVEPHLTTQGIVDILEGAVRKCRERDEPVPRSLLKVLAKFKKRAKGHS
jgi:hypothetical protein